MNKSRHISSLIFEDNSSISELYKKAIFYKKTDTKLKKILNLDFQNHFQLSNIEKNVVTIVVDSSAWATRLRYNIPKILKVMNDQLNFTAIKTIRIKVSLESSRNINDCSKSFCPNIPCLLEPYTMNYRVKLIGDIFDP